MKEPNSSYKTKRTFSKYNKLTVDALRGEIRNEFKQRILSQRNKLRDIQRHQNTESKSLEDLIRASAEDMKHIVRSEGQDDVECILDLIDTVEAEILLEEQQAFASTHEGVLEREVDSSLPKCIACDNVRDDKISYKSLMCKKCSADLLHSQ